MPTTGCEGHAIGRNQDALLIKHSANSFGRREGDTAGSKVKNQ